MLKVVTAFDNFLDHLSRYGLITSLFGILGLAVLSIILRWLGESVMWLDPLVRHLVFVSAFLGGSLATSKNVHIRVDLLTKVIENSNSRALQWTHRNIISLFCLVTTFFLARAGWDFYLVESEFGAPSFLDIPSSYLAAIIPFGMGLIALRFLNQLILGTFSGEPREHNSVQ